MYMYIYVACSCLSSHNFKISFVAHNASVSSLHNFSINMHESFYFQCDHTHNHDLGNMLCELLFTRSDCFYIPFVDSTDINDLIA